MRGAALLFLSLISALMFQAVGVLTSEPTVASATPSLSGAAPNQLINGDFSGEGLGIVGTPPSNHDFESGMSALTGPPNSGFSDGLADWTPTGTPTLMTGGPGGAYVELESGERVRSAPFTIGNDAQKLTFQIAAANSGSFQVEVRVYSGQNYATTSTFYFTACPGTCTDWSEYVLDAVRWQGQSIQVEVRRYVGNLKLDDVAVPTVALTGGWTVGDGTKVSHESGGPSGAYARTRTQITSAPFSVDSNAQNGSLTLLAETGTSFDVYVLSGTNFATTTKVLTGSSLSNATWSTLNFGLGQWAGQSIRLKIQPTGGSLRLDMVGVSGHVLPGWQSLSSTAVERGTEGLLGFVAHVDRISSGEITLDGTGYSGNARGNWVRIVYRMYENYNCCNADAGSTLDIKFDGVHVQSFVGMEQGGVYDPTRVWLEKYFFIYTGFGSNVVPQTGSFELRGWGTTIFGCNPSCGGRPDVALLEVVDGPGQSKVLASADLASRGALPPGVMARPVNDSTQDPVEVTSGNYYHSKTDLAIPGIGVPLTWSRSYTAQGSNNRPGVSGPMGGKWSHNWQASLISPDASLALVRLPMGASLAFHKVGGVWKPPSGTEASLVQNVGGDWTLTTAGQLVYAFDSSGQWTSVMDRNNNTTTLAYTSGKLSSITDASSRSLTISYTGDLITSVSDGTRTVGYEYDAAGDLVEVTDVMGETVEFEYQGHLLTKSTDAKGNVFVHNTYDAYGRVIEQRDADDGLTTIDYDTPGAGATRVTDQRGKQTTYYFDARGRITDVMDDDGGVTTTVWDSDNNATSVTNPLGKTWSYTHDSSGNVLTATDPLSKAWIYTYNSRNDVLTVTDPLSKVTTFGYDTAGNLTSVTDALNKTTTFTVNGQGLVTEVEDSLGHTTTLGYDSYGNRTTVTNALSKTWTYTYDGFGRVTSVTDPLSHATSFTYNAANLLLTATDALSNVTTYTYDKNGNVLTVTDANTNATTYTYDDRDLLTTITDAESGVWTFAYDDVGNLTSKTNPRGKTTTYTYDDLGRLASETDPLNFVRSYDYDLAGRLVSRTDPKSQTITYGYSDRNELTLIDYPDSGFVTFSYNDAGARTQMVDATGTTTYAYDDLYRLTSVTFPGSRTVGYGYDDAGRRTSITYPGGTNQVAYGYDDANRLTSVTDWNLATTTYAYDDAGRMTTATLPSSTGVVSTYSYDNADRLVGISHDQGGNALAFVNYTLDDVGNRTQRVDDQGTHTYAYDDLYRLTSVTYPGPSTTSYVFDAFGNRTSMTDASGATTYAYDDADRLTSVTPPSPDPVKSYTWDDNGNLTNRGSDRFAWDYEDRMTAATVGGVNSSYTYRGDGLRDSRTVGMSTTFFTWDISAGLPVVLDDGKQYVYGASLVSQIDGASTYYYLADGLGSTMKTVDSSGTVVNAYTYDVYGEITSSSGSQDNEFDFAGQQTDPTGLQYLRARYFDSETGRFASRDPIALLPSSSGQPYAAQDGNPVRFVDPTGLAPEDGGGASSWRFFGDLWHEDPNVRQWIEYHVTSKAGEVGVDGFRICTLINEKGRTIYGCGATIAPQDFHDRFVLPGKIDDVVTEVLNTVLPFIAGIEGLTTSRAKCVAKKAGYDTVHDFKADFVGRKGVSRFDLFVDDLGNVVIHRKGGLGEGLATGINIDGC